MSPRKMKDKIIFGSVLITNVIYTGYLYTVLTDFGLETQSELKIDTIKNLISSNLTPVFDLETYRRTSTIDIKNYQELRKKARLYDSNYLSSNCLKDMMKEKNLACIASKRILLESMKMYFKYGEEQMRMKLMNEPILYGTYLWMLEPGSPYAERVNQVLQNLVENGVLNKINIIPDTVQEVSRRSWSTERSESNKLMFLLLSLTLIGYSLSLMAFIGELFSGYFEKKKRNRITL